MKKFPRILHVICVCAAMWAALALAHNLGRVRGYSDGLSDGQLLMLYRLHVHGQDI